MWLLALLPALLAAIIHFTTAKDLTYAEVILAGGNDGTKYLSTAEVIGELELPPLPVVRSDCSLTAIGTVLYMCGGVDGSQSTTACYTLEIQSEKPTWVHNVTLPTAMTDHTAVAVDNHIWFAYNDHLYDLDTQTNLFHTYKTSFNVEYGHCAVSNSEHSFLVGVGRGRDEIWVNSVRNDPTEWHKLVSMTKKRKQSSCVMYDDKILIAGGEDMEDSVEIYDIFSDHLRSANSLLTGRQNHGSFILLGKPAVVGGYNTANGAFLNTVETFDTDTLVWRTENFTIGEAKDSFGLAQLILQI